MSSGWAGALGAAILGAQSGYQNGRQTQQDQAYRALQTAILQNQLNDLPKRQALEDANAIYQLSPEQALHNPAFVSARANAGVPVLTKPLPKPWELERNGIETPTHGAQRLGVAEETGAVIPPEMQAASAERGLKLKQTQALTDWMGAPSAQGAAQVAGQGQPEPSRYDPVEMQNWQKAKLAGIPMPEPKETSAHQLWMQQQELTNKATMKPPSAATERERNAYSKVQVLVPKLREALMGQVLDKNDPTGQNALQSAGGWMGLLGQRVKQGVKATAYDVGFPLADDDESVQQLAGALKVIGASPYMAGSRAMQMFNEAAVHLLDRRATPESQMQRLNTIAELFPEFEQAMGMTPPVPTHSGGAAPPPVTQQQPVPQQTQVPPQQFSPDALAKLAPQQGQPVRFSELQEAFGDQAQAKAQELIRQGIPVVMADQADWAKVPSAQRPR